MKYKYLIKKIMADASIYDAYYPEHKPIADKLNEMGRDNNYLHILIVRNRKSFREKHAQNPDEPIFNIIYWCLDFDITEEYIWFRAARNMESDGFKELCRVIAGL